MIGQVVGHYRIVSQLGAGGMGTVYRAEDLQLQRAVAIKFVSTHLSRSPQAHQRLLREARNASALDHPHVGVVHEVAETGEGQLYIVMALYEGGTLRQRLDQGPLAVEAALRLARQITEGLAAAHAVGIIHRDLKPENILLTRDGQVRIVDFGLAVSHGETRMLQAGSGSGSVAYMSPEQALGQEVDARGDLFSLGVILYEMLGGRPPFRGDSDSAVLYQVVHEEPPTLEGLRAEVPKPLRQLVARLLAKDPSERYQDAAAVLADLGSGRVRRRLPRRRALLVAAAAVAILGITTWWAWPRYLSETARFKREIVRLQSDKRPLVIAVAPFAATGEAAKQQAEMLRDLCVQELNRLLAGDQNLQVVLGSEDNVVRSDLEAEAFANRIRADVVLWGDMASSGGTYSFQAYVTAMPRALVSGPWVLNEGSRHTLENAPTGDLHGAADDMRSLGALIAAGYYAQRGNAANAVELLHAATGGGLWVQSRKTVALMLLGMHQEAAECAALIVAHYPASAEAHMIRADALYNLDQIEEAMGEYGLTQRLDPKDVEIYNRLGWANRRLGLDSAARENFQLAAEMSLDETLEGLYNRGEALKALGRYEDAARSLRRAVELAPYNIAPRAKLAEAYCNLGLYEKALAEFEIVLLTRPRTSSFIGWKVRTLLGKGQLDDADVYLNANVRAFNGNRGYFNLLWRIALLKRNYGTATAAACSMTSRSPRLYDATKSWLTTYGSRGEGEAQMELRRALHGRARTTEDEWFAFVNYLLRGGDGEGIEELVEGEDELTRRQRLCEFYYFIGMYHLLRAERGEGDVKTAEANAIYYLRQCVDTEVRGFEEYVDARFELQSIGGTAPR